MRVSALALAFGLAACTGAIDGVPCKDNTQCPTNSACGSDAHCHGGPLGGCASFSCLQQGYNCGQASDGCGGMLDCGKCSGTGVTCGGGGMANVCGCTPPTDADFCKSRGVACGPTGAKDSCGVDHAVASCGDCTGTGVTCGGGGKAGQCGCTPATDAQFCAAKNTLCGPASGKDNCGNDRSVDDCGPCTATGATCGGAGTTGMCGCTPETDAQLCAADGANCGALDGTDNCGASRHVASCGPACAGTGVTCGGGGTANICGCTPETDAQLCAAKGQNCGTLSTTDNCGGRRSVSSCGTCPGNLGQSCGGGTPSVAGACGCTPESDAALCLANSATCGTLTAPDNCATSRTVNCLGRCIAPLSCGGGSAPNACGCTPETEAALCAANHASCGPLTATDNCLQPRTVANCGTCGAQQQCKSSACVCLPETAAGFCMRLGAVCGSLTAPDNCGVARTVVSCGGCTTGQCEAGVAPNQCGVVNILPVAPSASKFMFQGSQTAFVHGAGGAACTGRVALSVGDSAVCFVRGDDQLVCSGNLGPVGSGGAWFSHGAFTPLSTLETNVDQLLVSPAGGLSLMSSLCFHRTDGTAWCVGDLPGGIAPVSGAIPWQWGASTTLVGLATGSYSPPWDPVCALDAAGKVQCAGTSYGGGAPVPVATISGATSLWVDQGGAVKTDAGTNFRSSASRSACQLQANAISCNFYYTFRGGTPQFIPAKPPLAVGEASHVVDVVAIQTSSGVAPRTCGGQDACWLDDNGTVNCVKYVFNLNTSTCSPTPYPRFAALSSGARPITLAGSPGTTTLCAAYNDGSLWCVGDDTASKLGNSSTVALTAETLVAGTGAVRTICR